MDLLTWLVSIRSPSASFTTLTCIRSCPALSLCLAKLSLLWYSTSHTAPHTPLPWHSPPLFSPDSVLPCNRIYFHHLSTYPIYFSLPFSSLCISALPGSATMTPCLTSSVQMWHQGPSFPSSSLQPQQLPPPQSHLHLHPMPESPPPRILRYNPPPISAIWSLVLLNFTYSSSVSPCSSYKPPFYGLWLHSHLPPPTISELFK